MHISNPQVLHVTYELIIQTTTYVFLRSVLLHTPNVPPRLHPNISRTSSPSSKHLSYLLIHVQTSHVPPRPRPHTSRTSWFTSTHLTYLLVLVLVLGSLVLLPVAPDRLSGVSLPELLHLPPVVACFTRSATEVRVNANTQCNSYTTLQ